MHCLLWPQWLVPLPSPYIVFFRVAPFFLTPSGPVWPICECVVFMCESIVAMNSACHGASQYHLLPQPLNQKAFPSVCSSSTATRGLATGQTARGLSPVRRSECPLSEVH
eukprot:GGOE01060880.1.p1 GENE.GGOE01060880.1~~GGOE01060880.1.p1  ORF type:complete len:110 (-),score=2.45 GGOE01060880.1:208-537(-)